MDSGHRGRRRFYWSKQWDDPRGATNQIEARVDGWRGKLQWDSQLGQLTTAALNSPDRDVRDSAQLAAYGLTKNASMLDALVRQASSRDHAKKIWALWSLGLLANRGVETDRVVQVLSAHLKDNQKNDRAAEDSRHWAVEGLALVGTNSTIAPLLDAMRDDPSAAVRERAACSLAESGMFTHEQRTIAVPRLIQLSGDTGLALLGTAARRPFGGDAGIEARLRAADFGSPARSSGPVQSSLWSTPLERGRIWQHRFYDFVVFTDKKRVELRYMHRNPVTRGLVLEPDQWQWSSYRAYAYDERGPVLVDEPQKIELLRKIS